MKRTKWFDGNKFIPAQAGVYERRYSTGIYQCFFDGIDFWVAGIQYNYLPISLAQNLPWRGLKDKP